MSVAQAQHFIDSMAKRQEAVQLGPQLPVSLAQIQNLAGEMMKVTPSPFNSQSTRMVMLVGTDHRQLWKAIANNNMYAEEREAIEQNLEGAAGTFLFFEDNVVIEGLQKALPTYAAAFPVFASHSSAMLINSLWEALSLENVAACVHHYSPDVAAQVAQAPSTWVCTGQLVFGSASKPALRVSRPADDSHRFKVAKGDQ